MPTYEYMCENCGHQFEQFQSITASSLLKCPECEKNNLRRLIGAGSGVIFKGSGFYQTDYRSEGYKKAQKSEKSSTSSSSKKKTESKSGDKKAGKKSDPAAKNQTKST